MQKGTLLTFIGDDALVGGLEPHSVAGRFTNTGQVGNDYGFKFKYNAAGDTAFYPLTGVIPNASAALSYITSTKDGYQGGVWYSTGATGSINDNIYGLSFTYFPRATNMHIHNQNHGSVGKNVRCVKE